MLGIGNHGTICELVEDLDNIKVKNYLTHNIHPYPAKFIPQIPACIIEAYSDRGNTILDPFCGSGTTLLEAILRGRNAIGLDSNPIATLISRVKTKYLVNTNVRIVHELLDSVRTTLSMVETDPSWLLSKIETQEIPSFHNIDHWFRKDIQCELTYLKKAIADCSRNNPDLEDFLNLNLSSIIVAVSNQDSDTRWVAVNKNFKSGFALQLFIHKVIENLRKNHELEAALGMNYPSATVITDDIKNITTHVPENQVHLIVTSPPYLNSYDYYLYHKLRMYWLGYDHRTVQEKEIGSRNKHSDKKESSHSYFLHLQSSMGGLRNLLTSDGLLAVVIGDSIYQGEIISTDFPFIQLMSALHFELIDKASYNQRKYTRSFTLNLKKNEKNCHILVFKKIK